MSQVINFIKLDFNRSKDITIPTIELDQGSRFVRVQLQNNNQSVDITGSQVAITVIRNDLEEIIESCNILDAKEGLIEFEISKSMVARQGDMLCQLKLSDNDSVLSSQLFKISVNNTLMVSLEESRSEMDVLIHALGEVQDINNRFAQINTRIEELFQSVSNGKELLASALTDKGIPTLASESFEEIARKILSLGSGEVEELFNLITKNGDSLVTKNGDNLIYKGVM